MDPFLRRQSAASDRVQVLRISTQPPATLPPPVSNRAAVLRQDAPTSAAPSVSERVGAVLSTAARRVHQAGAVAAQLDAEFTEGLKKGMERSLRGAVNFVTQEAWQAETWTELGTTVVAIGLLTPQHPQGVLGGQAHAQWLDRQLGTHVAQRQLQLVVAIDQKLKEMPGWNAEQWGELVGHVAADALLTRGAVTGVRVTTNVASTARQVASSNVAAMNLGSLSAGQAARTVAQRLPTIFTDSQGYFIGPIRTELPFSLRVQRYGTMSISRPDYWGPRTFGTSQWASRTFNAILPSWNNLSVYTTGVVPPGVNLSIGITGPQGWRYPGGLYQIQVPSRSVLEQATQLLPPAP